MIEELDGIVVKKSEHELPKWSGENIEDTYGNKPILDYKGKPLFAELYALRTYSADG